MYAIVSTYACFATLAVYNRISHLKSYIPSVNHTPNVLRHIALIFFEQKLVCTSAGFPQMSVVCSCTETQISSMSNGQSPVYIIIFFFQIFHAMLYCDT